MDTKEILHKLVAFDTQIQHNTLEAVNWVRNYLQNFGVEVSLIYNQDKTRASLMAFIGDKNRSGCVFSGHLDTVPADETFYRGRPFELHYENGRYYGRGACDMKGPIAGFLAAVPELVKAGKSAVLLLTHDEEGGFQAINQVTADPDIVKFLQNQQNCIVMEPSDLKAVTAHKGTRLLEVSLFGRSGHSSRPSLCIDAVDAAVNSYCHLLGGFRKLAENYGANPAFIEPYSTATVGLFNGGEAINTVADRAVYTLLSRENPGDDFEKFFADVFTGYDSPARLEIKQKLYAYAFKSRCKPEFIESLNRGQQPQAVNFGTEAGFFEKIGLPTVVFGPGNIAQAHTKDEYISAAQLEKWTAMIPEI